MSGTLVVLLAAFVLGFAEDAHSSVSMRFTLTNYVGEPVVLFWKNVDTGALVSQVEAPIKNHSTTNINSYAGHTFVVQLVDRVMVSGEFTVGHIDELITARLDGETIVFTQSNTITQSSADIATRVQECVDGDSLVSCIEALVQESVSGVAQELHEEVRIKKRLAKQLRVAKCANTSAESTPPMHVTSWVDKRKRHTVSHMFDQQGVKIMVIDDFLTKEHCEELRTRGEKSLTRAAVVGAGGKAEVSTARRADSSMVDARRTGPADILAELQDKTLRFTNAHTGYGLTHEGQEGFSLIRYKVGDEYKEHCDGSCEGMPHKTGGRVATMVMYCEVAEEGGATTFHNADVHVLPKPYQASFFSYMAPDRTMDRNALSEHSGCPITRGEKWITTLWMRDGVTAEENWTKFEPSGVRK